MLRYFTALARVIKAISQSTLFGYLNISTQQYHHLRSTFLPSLPYQNKPSTMASSSTGRSSRAAISTRVRIFLRYAAVHANREGHHFTKKVTTDTIFDAHNSDKSIAMNKKYDDSRPTARKCFQNPSNPYFYIPFGFQSARKNSWWKHVLHCRMQNAQLAQEYRMTFEIFMQSNGANCLQS